MGFIHLNERNKFVPENPSNEAYEEALHHAAGYVEEGSMIDADQAIEILQRNYDALVERMESPSMSPESRKMLTEEIEKTKKRILALGGSVEDKRSN